jgi:ankyrin repeat protein
MNITDLPINFSNFSPVDEDYTPVTIEDEKSGITITHKVTYKTDGSMVYNDKGDTWLHFASRLGNGIMLEGFITKGDKEMTDLNVKNHLGETPLVIALNNEKEKSVRLLVNAGASIEPLGEMMALAAKTNARIMKIFFEKVGNELVNVEAAHGHRPLIFAIGSKKTDVVRLLIEKGADINKQNQYGNPLLEAAFTGSRDIVDVLLDNKAQITQGWDQSSGYLIGRDSYAFPNATGVSPIFGAALHGDVEMMQKLLKAGDTPHRILSDKSNILLWAFTRLNKEDPKRYREEIFRILLEDCKVDPNQPSGPDGTLPIFHAIYDSKIMELLLKNGANPNVTNSKGESPLYKSCESDYHNIPAIIVALLNHGANPNFTVQSSTENETPFTVFARRHTEFAFDKRALELTQLFVTKGAKINDKNIRYFDKSPLVKNNPEFKKLVSNNYSSECALM